MHIFTVIILTIGALTFLVLGLLQILHDLLERGPFDAPLVEESPRQEESDGWSPDGERARHETYR